MMTFNMKLVMMSGMRGGSRYTIMCMNVSWGERYVSSYRCKLSPVRLRDSSAN